MKRGCFQLLKKQHLTTLPLFAEKSKILSYFKFRKFEQSYFRGATSIRVENFVSHTPRSKAPILQSNRNSKNRFLESNHHFWSLKKQKWTENDKVEFLFGRLDFHNFKRVWMSIWRPHKIFRHREIRSLVRFERKIKSHFFTSFKSNKSAEFKFFF